MKQQKLYFSSTDDTICYDLEAHFKKARDEGLTQIKLFIAVPDDKTNDIVWCSHYQGCIEKDLCKKNLCEHYFSNSGRGVCGNRGKLYTKGQEVVFDVS